MQRSRRLQRAGLLVVPITGRPAGWCDQIARMWPVHAVVGENGAFYFRYDHAAHRMRRRYVDDAATRAGHRERLPAIGDRILELVPAPRSRATSTTALPTSRSITARTCRACPRPRSLRSSR